MDNFNAKLGLGRKAGEYASKYGNGDRRDGDERTAAMAEANTMFVANWFQKKQDGDRLGLTKHTIHSKWKEVKTILLHKKGNKQDLKNY